MARLQFEYTADLPPAYAGLLWDTFFSQRSRGVSMPVHFPWITQAVAGQAFATLSREGEVLAGLTVKPCGPAAVAVGLVCVHPDHRGQGLSRQLLTQALARVDATGVAATTLWTSKPAVYEAHGFRPHDTSLVCAVRDLPALDGSAPASSWPDATPTVRRGLPPFAHHGLRLGDDTANALVLMDPLGLAVAEWHGRDDDVVALLSRVMPRRWRLHALHGDTLPDALVRAGAALEASPQTLQMWRPRPGQPLRAVPELRLLDRI